MITSKPIRSVAASLAFPHTSALPLKVMELVEGWCISAVVPVVLTASPSSLTQTTLDCVISTRPRVLQFTTAGLLDYIVELVVCEDEVRLFVQ
jgi:hypothetical protein